MNSSDKTRDGYYRRTYGISLDQYNSLRKKQKYSCFICRRHEKEFSRRLAVDHNHKTGEVRGLLCTYCNKFVIGRHTDPEILRRAALYLKKGTGWYVPKKKKKRTRKRKKK